MNQEVLMKMILLVVLVVFSIPSLGDVKNWRIIGKNGEFWLQHAVHLNVKAPITKRTGKSSVLESKSVGKDHEIIIYYTGMSGTFRLVDIYYAQIYDKRAKKFLGDYPWKYKSRGDNKAKLPQPKWKIGKNSISISEEQTDLKPVIKLN